MAVLPQSQPPYVTLDWKWFATFLLGLALNAGGTIWWAATTEARVAIIEQGLLTIQSQRPANLDRLTRVETTAVDTYRRLERIENKLDALLSK